MNPSARQWVKYKGFKDDLDLLCPPEAYLQEGRELVNRHSAPIIATKQFEFSKKKTFILPGGVEKEVLEGQFPKTGVRFELGPGGPVGFCGNAKDERQLLKKEQNEEKVLEAVRS